MKPEFNFYDFVGYLIPGSFVLLLTYWIYIGFLAFPFIMGVRSIGESIIFIVASYSIGHLIQAIGNIMERGLVKKWGGWYSEQILRDDNDYYTSSFKTNLKKYANKIFELTNNTPSNDHNNQAKRREEIFNLCYSLIVQENSAQHTEIFNGIYGLYRGLLVVDWIGIIVSMFIALKHFLLLIFSLQNLPPPQGIFWDYESLQLGLGIILMIFFSISLRPLESRLKRFSLRFADSVYRNFYVWYHCKIKRKDFV